MQTTRPLAAVVVTILVVGSAMVGVGGAQRGPPDDAGSGGTGPPAGVHDRSLVVTDVSLDTSTEVLEVTVANPGPRPVTVSILELEALQSRLVVQAVNANRIPVTAGLTTSTTNVSAEPTNVTVLKNVFFPRGYAVTDATFAGTREDAVRDVSPEFTEVVTNIAANTVVVEDILTTNDGDSSAEQSTSASNFEGDVSDQSTLALAAAGTVVPAVGSGQIFDVLYTSVVGEGDWTMGDVVGGLVVERQPFVVSGEVAVQVSRFLQPPVERDFVEVVKDVQREDVLDTIAWNTPMVVQSVGVTKTPVQSPQTSVWDAPALNGSQSIEIDQRQKLTLRFDLTTSNALIEGSAPNLHSATVIDGWLYDENGHELVHFMAEPGS